jgi:hypothetical protein
MTKEYDIEYIGCSIPGFEYLHLYTHRYVEDNKFKSLRFYRTCKNLQDFMIGE